MSYFTLNIGEKVEMRGFDSEAEALIIQDRLPQAEHFEVIIVGDDNSCYEVHEQNCRIIRQRHSLALGDLSQ